MTSLGAPGAGSFGPADEGDPGGEIGARGEAVAELPDGAAVLQPRELHVVRLAALVEQADSREARGDRVRRAEGEVGGGDHDLVRRSGAGTGGADRHRTEQRGDNAGRPSIAGTIRWDFIVFPGKWWCRFVVSV